MEPRPFDLLMLALLPGLHPRQREQLLSRADLGDVFSRPQSHGALLAPRAQEALAGGAVRRGAEAEVRRCAAAGVRLVALGSPDYPPLLSRITDPPPVLWVRGTLPDADRPSVAIVGSRQATGAGLVLARAMARDLARAGVTVVSGLALGIDGEAHRGALEGRGPTVGVLGAGLNQVYPAAHAELGRQVVARNGALVSEFPLEATPYKSNFPRRNRVIAGWSLGTVVVEAAARSGALVTARLALEEGREVMAVPGHPGTPTAEGTNALIRDGAALVRGAADVALELGLTLEAAGAGAGGEPLLEAFTADVPLSLDELQARSGLPVPELLQRLSTLELEQRVQRLPGALFVRGN
jgi:DNA processing protein